VQKSLHNLHCIRCGRCTPAGEAIEVTNNISICPKESFERELVINIDDIKDVMEVISLIKMLDGHS
jgi:ribosomal protein S26